MMERQGKLIILADGIIVAIGVVVWLAGDKMRWIGRLPGDIRIERENVHIYIPITTMILVSLFLTLIYWLVKKMGK